MPPVKHCSAVALLALAGGCASAGVTSLRFHNVDPIVAIDDKRPIPEPADATPGLYTHEIDVVLRTQASYGLSVPGPIRAHNINALDEVPDSSWFQNRIGVRKLDAAELLRGHGELGPDRSSPLQVRKLKQDGTAPGFIVEDARGDRYIIKFDPDEPETESGAEVVVQRLLWAAGYNVPENNVMYFERSDLVLAEGADKVLEDGSKAPLLAGELDAVLANVPRTPRGYRALASKYLAGKPVGGFSARGVRPDDPNDRIAHEHRREIRGAGVFFAWLSHTDVKDANTLDMWIEEPKGSRVGHLTHYLIDFGKALGVWGLRPTREVDGYAPHLDYFIALRSLLALGLWRRPWEGIEAPGLRGVGRYESERFEADIYSPANPYLPFFYMDRFDAFWAAKIIARLGREQVSAAVDAGQYSDPRARAYLVDTILARRRKTLVHWFSQVAPLDELSVQEDHGSLRVCAHDLWLVHALGEREQTRYTFSSFDWEGQRVGPERAAVSDDGKLCVEAIATGSTHDNYTLIAIETARGAQPLPPTIVHVARSSSTHQLRIVGIERL